MTGLAIIAGSGLLAGAGLALALMPGVARAEELVSTVSSSSIAITSSFDGEVLSLFGNVEPDPGAQAARPSGPYNLIVVITGPSMDRVARLKTNRLGIWINTEEVRFNTFPTFFHVLASDPLDKIADHKTLETLNILPDSQTRRAAQPGAAHAQLFGAELIRLMEEKNLFRVNDNAVKFLSPTAYTAQLHLPGDISNGLFITQTYLFKNGKLLAKRGDSFSVNKTGFERFVSGAARDNPLLYGLTGVLLALFTGWLAGAVFRR